MEGKYLLASSLQAEKKVYFRVQKLVEALAYWAPNLLAEQIERFFTGFPESLDGLWDFFESYFYLDNRHLSSNLMTLSLTVLSRFQIRRRQLADGPQQSL